MFSSANRSWRAIFPLSGVLLMWSIDANAGSPGHFGYGKPATAAEIAGWDIDVRGADGVGLPGGKGTVDHGADLFASNAPHVMARLVKGRAVIRN